MLIMKNFTQYSPEENNKIEGTIFIKDENDNDWYESQSKFSLDTIKIAYGANGVICSAQYDVSMLWPINLSVAEIDKSDIPAEFALDGGWVFDGESIKPITYTQTELLEKAEYQRGKLMASASVVIGPLQDAVDLNEATDEELASLKEWKTYRVALNRVDTSKAPDIAWPPEPA